MKFFQEIVLRSLATLGILIFSFFLLTSCASNRTTRYVDSPSTILQNRTVFDKDDIIKLHLTNGDLYILDSLKIDSVNAPVYKTITGIASFYSSNLHGSKTSTGETYRHERNTAASNNFKLNTMVRVTNLENNKSVIVRINDHMHKRMAKKGRVVDLSRSAAKKLDFMKQGLTRVKVEEVPPGTEE